MKRKVIKKHSDFLTDFKDPSARGDIFIIKTKPTKFPDGGRFGVIAAKRFFKLAVHRNRAKRLLRDWASFYERFFLPDVDYIFIARPPILKTTRPTGRKEMRVLLHKISKTYQLNEEKE